VIESFRHKGLKRLFEEDDRRKIAADLVEKIRLVLSALEAAGSIEDLNQPSFRLHQLKGDLTAIGLSRFARTGGLSSGLRGARRRTSTLSTTIDDEG
jgi:proteic killer suppression protein